jgi:hypothetical protein
VATIPYCVETTDRPYERSWAARETAAVPQRRAMRLDRIEDMREALPEGDVGVGEAGESPK